MSRRLRLFLIAAGLLAAAAVAVWLALPQLAETLITSRLAAMGLRPVTATVTRVDFSGAHLARLEAGDGALVLRDVTVIWSAGAGVEEVSVADAQVRGRWTAEDGLDLGALAPLVTGGQDDPGAAPFEMAVERVKIDKATAVVALPAGELVATASGTIKRADPGPALTLSADVTAPGLAGTLTFAGTAGGVGAVPATGDGWARLTAEGFAAPGVAGSVTGAVAAAVRLGADAVALTADGPVRLTLAELAPGLQAMIAPVLGEAPDRVALELSGAAAGRAPSLTISGLAEESGIVLSSEGLTVAATAGTAEARIAAGGSVRLAAPAPAAALREISAAVSGVSLSGAPLAASLEDGSLTLTAEGLVAEASVSGTVKNPALAGAAAEAAAFDGRLRLTGHPDLTGALFADAGTVTLTGLTLAEGVEAADPVVLTLAEPAGPLLRLHRGEEGAPVAALAAGFRAPALALTTPRGPARIAFEDLAVTAAFGPSGGAPVATLAGSGGRLSAAGADLRAVTLKAVLAEGGPTVDVSGNLDALPGEPADLAARSPLRPYRLSLHAAPAEAEERVAVSAELRDVGNTLIARADGSLDLADGSGRATVRMPRQVFDPQGLKPGHLYGLLGTFVHDVTGAVAIDGTLRWGPNGFQPNLKVLLQDVGLQQGFVTLARVNGVVVLTSLNPLRTPRGQQVSVAAIDAGLPLLDAVASFEIADDTLLLDAASATLAGGTIRARPAAIPLSLDEGTATLDVHDLRLAPLVELAGIEGLRARGRLAGTVPLRFAGGDVIIDNAVLESMRPERVAYTPEDVPGALAGGGESVGLVLEAMEDFHYDKLSLTVDGRASGQMTVKLHIAGANPNFYDGYPVEFNLSVSGELAKAVQAGLAGYRVPDRIRERMEEFGNRP